MARRHRSPRPHLHLAVTLAWSWSWWTLAAAVGNGRLLGPALVPYVLGGLGPLLVAAALVHLGFAEERPAAFWRRAFDPRRVRPLWWVVIGVLTVVPPALVRLATMPSDAALVDPGPAAFLAIGALAGAAEEPGWRGYALDGLLRTRSPLVASVVVGVVWAAWHLPLFWIAGTYQHGLEFGTEASWLFLAAILVSGVLYGWLYDAVAGATVAAVGFHALSNVAGELFPTEAAGRLALVVHVLVVAALVAASWRRLTRPGQGTRPLVLGSGHERDEAPAVVAGACAEGGGFEPPRDVTPNTDSSRAP
jgi:uncharacterized protein